MSEDIKKVKDHLWNKMKTSSPRIMPNESRREYWESEITDVLLHFKIDDVIAAIDWVFDSDYRYKPYKPDSTKNLGGIVNKYLEYKSRTFIPTSSPAAMLSIFDYPYVVTPNNETVPMNVLAPMGTLGGHRYIQLDNGWWKIEDIQPCYSSTEGPKEYYPTKQEIIDHLVKENKIEELKLLSQFWGKGGI